MRDLLERWSKIEATRCQARDGTFVVLTASDEYRRWHQSTCADMVFVNGEVLAVVIDSIQTRGWYFWIDYLPWDDEGYQFNASVQTSGVAGQSIPSYDGCEETPAAALLSAYLNAIEAT